MEKFNLKNIIDKYLSGSNTEKEKKLLDSFYDSYADEKTEIDNIEKKNIEENVRAEIVRKTGIKRKHRRSRYSRYTGIAASIIIFILLGTGLLYYNGVFDSKPVLVWNEKVTQNGEKSTLTFLDGTKIILNGGTKLKYNTNPGKSTREVYLEGEAYFEVAHFHDKPFIVYSGDIFTTVLGTKFDVKAFAKENKIKVSLVEGSVKVNKAKTNENDRTVQLKPNRQLTFDRNKDLITVGSFDLQETIGWKDNILKFSDDPLVNVFKRLERAFGIEFELADTSYASRKFTGDFDNDSFWTIVKVITKLTGLNYKTVEENNMISRIVFYNNEK